MNRKSLTGLFAVIAAAVLASGIAVADDGRWDIAREEHHGSRAITVYRDASCGCCSKWIDHLDKHGFNVTDRVVDNLGSIKDQNRVPANMASCHTAVIDGYVIEGHVPADDIKRMIRDKPDVTGLAVPRMPVGTPGMEMGGRWDPFNVYQFASDGEIGVFRSYPNQ